MSFNLWQMDLLTTLSSLLDVTCFLVGVYLIISRISSPATKSPSSSVQSNTTPVTIPTYSVWSRKSPKVVLLATIATTSWHFLRLLIMGVVSYEADVKNMNDMDAEEGPVNPLMVPPVLYAVLALPGFLVLSRMAIVATFAFPKRQTVTATAGIQSPSTPTTPRRHSFSSKRGQSSTLNPIVHHDTSSSLGGFVSSLASSSVGRVWGPNQNVFIVAFEVCFLGILAVAPFSHHLIWYMDTPRIELMTTLYLTGCWYDLLKIRSLNAKDRRQRGIPVMQRIVIARWISLGILFSDISHEFGWRLITDGTAMYLLYRVEVA